MVTIAVELYNWHSKTANDNKLIVIMHQLEVKLSQ